MKAQAGDGFDASMYGQLLSYCIHVAGCTLAFVGFASAFSE